MSEIDSLTLLTLRLGLAAIVFAPFVLRFFTQHTKLIRKQWRNLAISSVGFWIGMMFWFMAIERSSASYASVLYLLAPIALVFFSARIIKDRVSRRARTGITLATFGGLVAVALPAILNSSVGSSVYPLATILLLIVCVIDPLAVIYQRRANEAGVPMVVCIGLMAITGALASMFVLSLAKSPDQVISAIANLSISGWLAVVYMALALTFLSQSLTIKSFERLGAAVTGGFLYLTSLGSIVLPLIVLGEQLSIEMTVGALLILLGVYIAQSHAKRDGGPLRRFLNRNPLFTYMRFWQLSHRLGRA